MGHNLLHNGLPVLGADGMPVKAPRGGLGRWGNTSTPHRGWLYDEPPFLTASALGPSVERGGFLGVICEMCQSARLVNIHCLKHPNGQRLHVGFDCAEYMIGATTLPDGVVDPADSLRVRKIEADAKWFQRQDFNGGAEWYQVSERLWRARIYGMELAAKQVGHGWQGQYKHRADDRFTRRSGIYPTREAAKRVTRRAALIAWRTKPWKGAAEFAFYRTVMAERTKARAA